MMGFPMELNLPERPCKYKRCGVLFKPASERADGLIDLEYVTLGTHVLLGINSTPLWQEVQKCNMAKEGGATRYDGKICKPPNWIGPDIEGALRKQGWSEAGSIEEVAELTPTERGDKGFGSTGR